MPGRKHFSKTIILIAALLNLCFCFGQRSFGPDYEEGIPTRFEVIGAEQGLPNYRVEALFQDRRGFIWLGSPTELAKYDGHSFQTYRYVTIDPVSGTRKRHSIYVKSIAEDENGNLWVGCRFEGPNKPVFFKFDRESEQLIPYFFADTVQIIKDDVNQILIDHEAMWLHTHPLIRIDLSALSSQQLAPDNLPYEAFRAGEKGLKNFPTGTFTKDERDHLWLPFLSGAYEWLPEQDTFLFHSMAHCLEKWRVRTPHPIECVISAKNGWYWAFLYQKGYLLHFNPELDSMELKMEPDYIGNARLLQTTSGQLWLGSSVGRGGLNLFDPETGKMQIINVKLDGVNFFPLLHVLSLMEDFSGNIWIGSRYGPLLKFEPQRNQFHWLRFNPQVKNSLSHDCIRGIDQTENGDYWISTYGGGLNQWKREENTFIHFRKHPGQGRSGPTRDYLSGLTIAADDKVWFGEGFSVGYYDPTTGNFKHYPGAGVAISVLADREHRLWAAHWGGGLRQFDPAKDDFIYVGMPDPRDSNKLIHPPMTVTFQDSRGYLWMGSADPNMGGFYRYDPRKQKFRIFDLPLARSFCEDRTGNIWVGSEDGLHRYNPMTDEFKRYGKEDGMPNTVVECLQEDHNGQIWIATDNGLSRFDPKEQRFRNYFQSDGLPHNKFRRTSYKNEKGELFFGGDFGLLYFHPDSLQDNRVPPKLSFTGIDLFGENVPIDENGILKKHISLTKRLKFAHWQNDITIRFTALHYKNARKNQYRIWLENFNSDWRDVGNQRTVHYTNLDPGHYTFHVKAANSDGIWNEEGISLDIIIQPPWYWNAWMQLLYFLLAIGLVLGVYRFQLNRRLSIVEANRLRELDEVKTNLYTNITHEFRTPLTVIQGISDQIQGHETEKTLIRRNSGQLLKLVNQMLDLARLDSGNMPLKMVQADIVPFILYLAESLQALARTKNIRLSTLSDLENLTMDFDPEKLQQIIVNLLSNAIKFTPEGGKVSLLLVENNENGIPYLYIKIRDTGPGIPEAQITKIFDRFYQIDDSTTRTSGGTGIGLALAKELAIKLGGDIQIESKVGKGTTLLVQLPISRQAMPQQPQLSLNLTEEMPVKAVPEHTGDPAPVDNLLPIVLLIEDNPDVVVYIKSCLEKNYQVVTAGDGQIGIEKAKEQVPDLIICDVMMPRKNGYEVCKALKNDERTNHIPIVMLTAKANQKDKLAGLQVGADAFLTKPFDRSELLVRLEKLLALRRVLQSRYTMFKSPDDAVSSSVHQQDAFVLKMYQVVEAGLNDPAFGIIDLQRAATLSHMQVYRKLKALTGRTPSQFIRSIRLQKGLELLKTTSLTVSEVAYSVGFSDPNYFSATFLKEFGQRPSVIRKQLTIKH